MVTHFIDKCATIAIGFGLCWIATIASPGRTHAIPLGDSTVTRVGRQPSIIQPNIPGLAAKANGRRPSPQRHLTGTAQQLVNELRRLGASYLRVERITSGPRQWYRAQCELGSGSNTLSAEANESTVEGALRGVYVALQREASADQRASILNHEDPTG